MRFRAVDIATIVGGRLVGADVEVAGAAIDSRTLTTGQLFVPVRGLRDGHDFIAAARQAGAAATLSAGPVVEGFPTIVVADPEAALRALGGSARGRLGERVVGITGSVGKTSTKDLVAAVLARRLVVSASEKSFNNELGVPLTLVNAADDTEVTVVEMGARGPGHIESLCAVAAPTIGVVTAVELVHAELMGGLDDIALAKGELVEGLPGAGIAVLNADDARVWSMRSRTGARVIGFGIDTGDLRATDLRIDAQLRPRFRLESDWGHAEVVLSVRGRHQVSNALAAAAVALACELPLEEVVAGLAAAELSPWRMDLRTTATGARVLNDAYNAGPASMEAAVRALAALPAVRHTAVLGVMAELGEESAAAHRHITEVAAEVGVRIIAFGVADYGSVDPAGPVIGRAEDIDDALAQLGELDAGDAVLVKGSRVAGLERLAAALLET
ncbi:MAG: UDP-N-acetylmuramoyl-tripeptide--D-alanyl-D-alanine ligase [Acidobacteria bacterium]|nr:UDP-N-acetylmuramoyl-tripeptide--D-alanyl-D-alanine ligase [Acidobacteriota bacterium]